MINLEEVLEMWKKDSVIDDMNLDDASKNAAKLHAKYLEFVSVTKLMLKKRRAERETLKKDKWLWYMGKMPKEDMDKRQHDAELVVHQRQRRHAPGLERLVDQPVIGQQDDPAEGPDDHAHKQGRQHQRVEHALPSRGGAREVEGDRVGDDEAGQRDHDGAFANRLDSPKFAM